MQLSIKNFLQTAFLLYLLIYLVTLPTISFAASTWYVNATKETTCKATACGSDCKKTLAIAISASAAGDTIYVCSNNSGGDTNGGLFTDTNIDVDRALNIYGNQSNTRITYTGALASYLIGLINEQGTNLSNFNFVSSQSTSFIAVYIAVNNASVFENNITNSSIGIYVAAVGGDRSSTIYNNRINNSNKGIFIEGSSVNVTNNTIFNTTIGIFVQTGANKTNITNNLIYNNTQYGIVINGSSVGNRIFNNIIQNHTSDPGYGIVFTSVTGFTINHVYSNTLKFNLYGVLLNASNFTNISGNTFNSNTNSAFLINSYNNIIVSNNIYNTTTYAISVAHGNGTNITSNIIQNASIGIILDNASSSNLSHNNITLVKRGTGFGVHIASSNHSFLWNNSASNNSDVGFSLDSSSNNTLLSNIAYNNTRFGFLIDSGSNNNNLDSNIAYNNSDSGFIFQVAHNNNLTSNLAYNNSISGFAFSDSTGNNLSQNNATNNLGSQYQFEENSNATFTGTNRAFNTLLLLALDLNITGGSNVTTLVGSTYNNFSSENLTIFFHNAINVSVKFKSNDSAGAAKSLCSTETPESCNLISFNGYNTVLNISNTSGLATINLGIYFNASEFNDSNERTTVNIGKYSNGWLEVGRSVFDGSGSIRYDSITSFSLFGAVAFKGKFIPDRSSPGTPSLSIDFSTASKITCPGNLLELVVISNGKSISDVLVSLILYEPYAGFKQEKLTNAEGRATFDLTNEKQGKYQVESSKSGYAKPNDVFFDFVKCTAGVEPQPEEEEEIVEKKQPIEPQPIVEPEINQQKEDASKTIDEAESAIAKAEKENKDVTSAKLKLREARDAFNKGDYEKAAGFAAEALQLVNNAKPLGIKPAPQPEPKLEEPKEEKPTEQPSSLDLGQMGIGLLILILILFVIYKLFSKKEKGQLWFKR